jgi:Helix-turn-helix domain
VLNESFGKGRRLARHAQLRLAHVESRDRLALTVLVSFGFPFHRQKRFHMHGNVMSHILVSIVRMDADIATIVALIGDPTRANMLLALMGGLAFPAGELATCANVAPQTASSHLSKLLDAKLHVYTFSFCAVSRTSYEQEPSTFTMPNGTYVA